MRRSEQEREFRFNECLRSATFDVSVAISQVERHP